METSSTIIKNKSTNAGKTLKRIESTLRNQIIVWRLGLGSLFIGILSKIVFQVTNQEYFTPDEMISIAFKSGVAFIMLLLYYITYRIGHWDDIHTNEQLMKTKQTENIIEYTQRVTKYLIGIAIPAIKDPDKQLEVIKTIPKLFGLLSIDELTKNMGMFQESLVDSLSLFEKRTADLSNETIRIVREGVPRTTAPQLDNIQ